MAAATTKKPPKKPKKAAAPPELGASQLREVFDRLGKLNANRSKSIKRIGQLTKERKSLDEEIRELGGEKSKRKDALKAEFYDVIKGLELERSAERWFADQIGNAIEDAHQGKFEFLDQPIKPTADMLLEFKPHKPKPDESWREDSVESIKDATNRMIAALKDAEIFSLGDLADTKLADIKGLTPSDIALIDGELHRRQEAAVNGDDEGDEDQDGEGDLDPLGGASGGSEAA